MSLVCVEHPNGNHINHYNLALCNETITVVRFNAGMGQKLVVFEMVLRWKGNQVLTSSESPKDHLNWLPAAAYCCWNS